MKQTINFYDFDDAFRRMDRLENFSYDAKKGLFEWLEQYEEDAGEELELDVIALCCDFTELELSDIELEYNESFNSISECIDWLNEQTAVVWYDDNSVLFQVF